MTVVLVILLVIVLLAAAVTVAIGRRRRVEPATPEPTAAVEKGSSSDVAPTPDVVETTTRGPIIVSRLSNDLAVVFGEDTELATFGESVDALTPAVATGIVSGNAALQALPAGSQASGRLVRLTEESAAALTRFGPINDASGAILGVVRDDSGKFVKMMRFEPAAAAGKLATVASLASAASAIALQMQLQQLSKAIAEVGRTTKRIEAHQNDELIVSVQVDTDELTRATETYQLTGQTNETDWSSLAPHLKSIRKNAALLHKMFENAVVAIERLVPDGKTPDARQRLDGLTTVCNENAPGTWAYWYLRAQAAAMTATQLELYRRLTTNDEHLQLHVDRARQSAARDAVSINTIYERYCSAVEAVGGGDLTKGVMVWRHRKSVVQRLNEQIDSLNAQADRMLAITRSTYRKAIELNIINVPEDLGRGEPELPAAL